MYTYIWIEGWEECIICECIVSWAYVKDLLPKGGER